MHALDAGAPTISGLYVVLLCLLGLLLGSGFALVYQSYERWVGRKELLPGVARAWRGVFGLGVGLPLVIVPAYYAGVTPGLPSDLTEGYLYLITFLGGFIGLSLYLHVRGRRRGRR